MPSHDRRQEARTILANISPLLANLRWRVAIARARLECLPPHTELLNE